MHRSEGALSVDGFLTHLHQARQEPRPPNISAPENPANPAPLYDFFPPRWVQDVQAALLRSIHIDDEPLRVMSV